MSWFRPRPRFERTVPVSTEEAIARIRAALAAGDTDTEGAIARTHLTLHVPEAERHFWSPVLDAKVVPDGDGCRIHGRFGPHPNAWTLFVFLRAAFLFGLISSCA